MGLRKTLKRSIKWTLSRSMRGKEMVLFYGLSDYLESLGWFRSEQEKLPVDKDGNCLPWYTYPMIAFLRGRVQPNMTVFEYGSGNSTLWWSERVASVVSCEHDEKWHAAMKDKLPANVNYIHCPLKIGGEYCKTILAQLSKFDVVVIDGRDRVNCAKNAPEMLSDAGVIIWDNTDRKRYREGCEFLNAKGFRRLDFEGMIALGVHGSCTSVFYRDNNCFGI